MNLKCHFFYISMCLVLVIALLYSLNKDCQVEPIIECTTDTLYFYHTDTIVEYKPLYVEKKVTDTLYIETKGDSLLSLPITQKRYSKPKSYDLWISGVEPLNLDSCWVYNNTEYKTITNTITNTVVDDKPRIYVLGGLNAFSQRLRPNLNISLTTKEKWLYSLEIGLDRYDKVYYGGKIGYRIY